MLDPFDDITAALAGGPDAFGQEPEVRVDRNRRRRSGAPEIVLAAGKSDAQIVEAVRGLVLGEPRVLISRIDPDQLSRVQHLLDPVQVDAIPGTSIAVAHRDGSVPEATGGRIGCLSAGSSDIPIAMEAVIVAREMGCTVETAWDVGVAGLHRLVEPLRRLTAWEPDVLIVAAGMDGVLPTVVAGLCDLAVIGLPVGTGYGRGGGGEAALGTMLQSCAPGVVVVNINNGVGAGVAAGLIANRAARARRAAG